MAALPDETTNNYGVANDYALGLVQTWNADLSRDFRQVWNVSAGYTHTRGSSLDIVRAPNRDPDGLRIEGVQPFLWETSEGSSVLHAASFRLRRRPVNGIGFGASYTLARSRDNASSLGGGGTVVAQNDQDLDAEWGLSSFDRRHQLTADTSIELPFGPNRPWLNSGGMWGALLRDWRFTTSFTWQSGTPLTARVLASVERCAARHHRHAARRLQRRQHPDCRSNHRSVLQHRGVFGAGGRVVRHIRTQPDHRSREPTAERAVLTRRADGRQPCRDAAAECQQPAQPRELRRRWTPS